MNELVFTESTFRYLEQALLGESSVETCAILLMSRAFSDTRTRFLVREVVVAPPESYTTRTDSVAELSATFVSDIVQRARNKNMAIGFVHTHVGIHEDIPHFSTVDDVGEQRLLPFLIRRTGTADHVSLVLSKNGMFARMLGTDRQVTVCRVGANVTKMGLETNWIQSERYDRQIRAFGEDGQALLASQRVGIVGLGGTGSIVAQSLAYLGVTSFVLVDHDTVSETNLNRLVGASQNDICRLKVDVAQDTILRIQPNTMVRTFVGDVTEKSVSRELRQCDFIFACTDSQGSRAVLNQFAYQYLTPVIDMGMSLKGESDGVVSKITGRVQMLSPGVGCLVCGNLLDYDQVRWDFMNQDVRNGDPYFIGPGQVAPAVISINSTVASLAVTMFLGAVAGIPSESRLQIYDGVKGTVRSASLRPVGGCIICSDSGVLAKGDSMDLPGRVRSETVFF